MPYLVEVTLAVERDAVAPVTARQLHGAAVGVLQPADDRHHDQVKPFSVWPLMVSQQEPTHLVLRVGWLPDSPPTPGLLEAGRTWRFGSLLAHTIAVAIDHRPYGDLANGPAAASVRLDLISPTCFSRSGREFPLPDPFLVFRGLASRWDAFADGFTIGGQAADGFVRDLDVVDFQVAAAPVILDRRPDTSGDAPRDRLGLGFTGFLEVRPAPTAPSEASAILGALARFADFSGVGAMTTRGLGACSSLVKEAGPA